MNVDTDTELDLLYHRVHATYYRARVRVTQGHDRANGGRSIVSKVALCLDMMALYQERQRLILQALRLDPSDILFLEMLGHATERAQDCAKELLLYGSLHGVM